ncbi:MAG: hypothetical protein VR65_19885 [Desulfobulbaceae bacterium BRH_c16a]|nr:MAG: hypothetical protein VR65_19885 [Desulfobulbaceae bacterium BRH_c16a]
MFEVVETAKKMIVKLNEIQPAVSVAGMDQESEAIKGMKMDLVMMISSLTPDHPCMQRVLVALREDVVSSGVALHELLGGELDDAEELNDGQIHVAMLAAEAFVLRAQDYLNSKRKAFELGGGKYGRA